MNLFEAAHAASFPSVDGAGSQLWLGTVLGLVERAHAAVSQSVAAEPGSRPRAPGLSETARSAVDLSAVDAEFR